MSKSTVSFYNLAWRWHFYAGLFVIPFMIMLAVTGSIYLFKPQLDNLPYSDLMQVRPSTQALTADEQAEKVRQAYPQAAVSQYLPPADAGRSAQFVVSLDGRKTNLFLDPYSGEVLGTQDAENNLQAISRSLHGTLLIGTVGDRLIELAAGWAIVLVVSGLYLWWPRGQSMRGVFWPRLANRGRLFWRDLHAVTGFWGSLLLLFMLLTGMTWTGFWGEKFADVWNRFPAAMWNEVPKSEQQARSLNSAADQTVAWAVENTPLPVSDPHAAHKGHDTSAMTTNASQVSLQQVVDAARDRGVVPGYSITLPADATGVFSIAVFADDPRNDATLHLDQYSGKVLADIRWQDYGLVAKSVEMGVVLHEGKFFGLANQLLMLGVCLLILLSAVSGLVMWWKRRPQGSLGVPPLRHDLPLWKTAVVIMIGLGIAFPLVGMSLAAVWALDRLVLSRIGGSKVVAG
ncbi:PepSY domain-containing protein [Pseudomonas sp. BN417]|uniref:PepSY-associated TM helix domain-containing protein n=1 Tax=Pseudomonas sp. BN417 TaxID=2567890 RepID=UPI002453F69C|nr:PepSY domain-containing protein [Pseudomonas sp. BN417]MDH4558834.1 PepSY domain-containing protein [Pseudomonas sp. BN417]